MTNSIEQLGIPGTSRRWFVTRLSWCCWLMSLVSSFASAADSPQSQGLQIQDSHGAAAEFQPRFLIFQAEKPPNPALRYADIPNVPNYNVLTWGRDPDIKPDPNLHIQDGFDPEVDRKFGKGRTANVFSAAPFVELTATQTRRQGNRIDWSFADHPWGRLSATVKVDSKAAGLAELNWSFTPRQAGFYSVAYVGAPALPVVRLKEIWQPMIWTELRFPTDSFLTPAFLCTLPGTMMNDGSRSISVMAASDELPFLPMPTNSQNNPFGVALRDRGGEACPMIFAPILGGEGSRRKAMETMTFRCTLHVSHLSLTGLYEQVARQQFGFRDLRENRLCSMNRTLDNMVEFGMSKWSEFNKELRGAEYSTDAPGTVKNVSPLPALEAAIVLDDERIYHERALPMLEYVCSREKLLFATSPDVKIQSPSWKLTGPASTLPDLAACYAMSGGRSDGLRKLAQEIFGIDKIYNLDTVTSGTRWQNSLALFRITGDNALLERARQQARAEIAERQGGISAAHQSGSFFWPAFTSPWIDYLELYEATGDAEFLEAARDGARRYLLFCWMCPKVPDGTVRVDSSGLAPRYRTSPHLKDIPVTPSDVEAWQVSEIGLTPESAGTCKGHRAILNAHYAPFMARIGWLTKDRFLQEAARCALVGRYQNFPGYHMNTNRTAVYMAADFPMRPQAQLNATTSIHYNHIWSHIGLMIDALVTEGYVRSEGEVDFPSRFTEGYAYLQSKVYGDRPGKFYSDDDVWLWMPPGLLEFQTPEINYLSARRDDALYLLLMNESNQPVTETVRINPEHVEWSRGGEASSSAPSRPLLTLLSTGSGGASWTEEALRVQLPAKGLAALRLDHVTPRVRFQDRITQPVESHWTGPERLTEAGATGIVFSYGKGLTSAYLYTSATPDEVSGVTWQYTIDGQSGTRSDTSYPFDETIPLPDDANEIRFSVQLQRVDGTVVTSKEGVLRREQGGPPASASAVRTELPGKTPVEKQTNP
ncbi:hypothetical protein [Planctomicrobium sp. SH664]|uniref:hypothetical protein n=1 Tax=Planctomicrobium sp. SH664 TaxID=3448125 RepID=UPI003F5B8C43